MKTLLDKVSWKTLFLVLGLLVAIRVMLELL